MSVLLCPAVALLFLVTAAGPAVAAGHSAVAAPTPRADAAGRLPAVCSGPIVVDRPPVPLVVVPQVCVL